MNAVSETVVGKRELVNLQKEALLTSHKLKEILQFDPEIGEFRWKINANTRTRKGDIAGGINAQGSARLKIDGQTYYCARLAIFYETGVWPVGMVHHINGNPADFRFSNLIVCNKSTFAKLYPKERKKTKTWANSSRERGQGGKPCISKQDLLKHEDLIDSLFYDPDTGIFTWKKRLANACVIGAPTSNVKRSGYKAVKLFGVSYIAHRLAWFYVYGEWPKEQIDHINGVRDDNRISNLRECSKFENMRNIGVNKRSTTGVKGVSQLRDGSWRVSIRHDDGAYSKVFWDMDEAVAHAIEKREELHGEFCNHGTPDIPPSITESLEDLHQGRVTGITPDHRPAPLQLALMLSL